MNLLKIVLFFVFFINFSTAQLQIVVPQNSPTFIYDNTPLHTNVFVRNTGKEFIRIVRIQPSCGCVKTSLTNEWVSPNTTVRIKIDVVPPFAKKIHQTWYIKIYTNTSSDSTTVFIKAYTINRTVVQNIIKDIVKFVKVFSWITLF
ncbi:DUF1573 domain-containing protein [Candidatus Uabimicrobium amorphum]|uniref:DUF1573 domain-containing protein n=1 Tax=Uabimicrobium amorphum TaxID=2596890 RepID=A0A5S9INC8_UABAM|nr:DUF1573 domain-containing protein [Candidatus Uabimicrobium amorphum]BBM84707.1 hypothetical protein UABAM_03068 [Candidatus Uabimicrobium amorphum]